MKCKWCDKAEDQCICDPGTKALNVQIEGLTTELGEVSTKLAEDGVTSEGMTEIQKQIKALTDQVGVLTAEKEKIDNKSNQEALAAQLKTLTDSVSGLTGVRTKSKIEFPVDNGRAGSCDLSTKLWANILIGNVGLKEGVITRTIKGGDQKFTDMKKLAAEPFSGSKAIAAHGTKALAEATATQGAEWVLSGVINEFFDLLRLENKLLSQFRDYPMDTLTDTIPMQVSDMTWYLWGESTSNDDTGVTASELGTGNVSVTAKKFMGRTWYSSELNEDSIVPLVASIRNNIIVTAGETIEDVLINGDNSGTHMDNDITGSTNILKAWKGFRRLAIDASMTSDMSTLSVAKIRAVKTKMGKFSIDATKLIWVLGATANDKIDALTIGTTNQGFDTRVTITDGQISKLFGIPTITSGKVREDLTAAGVYDGTTTDNGTITLIRTDRFVNGNRRSLTIKTAEKIESDQVQVVGSFRRGFAPVRTPNATTTGDSAEATVSMGIDLDAS